MSIVLRSLHSRRSFVKQALAGAAAARFLSPWDLVRSASARNLPDPASPISRIDESALQTSFSGDEPDLPHDVLWDKENFLREMRGIPSPTERVEVAVIGGGIAGLASAYALRDLRPLILEGAANFGGNSRGESWGGVDYSIGAAYITLQDEGSFGERLLKDLKLFDRGRVDDAQDAAALIGGSFRSPFWSGATDPARAAEFKRAWDAFAHVRDNAYPDIPLKEGSQLGAEQLAALDRTSFLQWLRSNLGTMHPHLSELVHEYCWSSFAADPSELSAAQGLNFLAADLGGDMVFAGGNAAIARALHRELKRASGPDRVRASCFVIDVERTDEGVRICYLDGVRKLHTVIARACVVACPKFVARAVISGLGREQDTAMSRIKYRAYLAGNILIRGKVADSGYDVFCLNGSLEGDAGDPKEHTNVRPFTDIVFANWAAGGDGGDNTVLTVYKGLPYDGARQFAFSPSFYQRHRGLVENALPSLLKTLGVQPSRVHDVRMTRWGHALPVAATGLLASGRLEAARAPVGGRVFFANQDNYANPSFEAAISSAEEAAAAVRAALTRGT